MKKSITFFGTMALTLAIGVLIGQVGRADTPSTPGSADDPIVTKSYVDAKLAAIGSGNTGGSTGNTGGTASSSALVVVQLAPNHVLRGGAGTEIILRSGQATAVASSSGGVADVTGGGDLADGTAITANHLLLVPRDDGRGIKAGSFYTDYVMVRGSYTVQ